MFNRRVACFYFLLFASFSSVRAQSKEGLVYIPTEDPGDLSPFIGPKSDLSWYYNYGLYPTSGVSLSFTPMLHSLPVGSSSDFLSSISSLLDSDASITHMLSFNEPDMPTDVGGSDISPQAAAQAYISYMEPLRTSAYNSLRIALPSTSGSSIGLDWLHEFNTSCYKMNPRRGCSIDFIATHWYGDFGGLASWLGQLHELYPQLPIWLTEWALPASPLAATEASFNQTIPYLRNLAYVERYAWFGTFLADTANSFVGPNVSFLDSGGQLTDLGSWYLGGNATGNLPLAKGAASGLDAHLILLWLSFFLVCGFLAG